MKYSFWEMSFQSLVSFLEFLQAVYLTSFISNSDYYWLQQFVAKLFLRKLSHLNMQDSAVTPGMSDATKFQSSRV